ncbi:MAG TPA: asparaginase [Campylobacterales bacterium]|nr:asparaginase [Campylobacterales bacterium]HIO71432.1 asparaginase [Campylobacterales bacterium]
MELLVINTGGTFNKIYNKINGKLEVPQNNLAVKKVIESCSIDIDIEIVGRVFKDSLEMTEKDREEIYQTILEKDRKKVIIIHGTDTIDKTADYLDKKIEDRTVILTGGMFPVSIRPTDGALNFGVALGYLQHRDIEPGIYISMSGIVEKFNRIYKDREIGAFRYR